MMSDSIHFYKTSSEISVGDILADKIISNLRKKISVLWLISGGSTIDIALHALSRLACHDLSLLTLSLVDERYGEVGHPGSNWSQLIDSGAKLAGIRSQPILTGQNIQQTTTDYEDFFNKFLNTASYKLALLGMGADGHTAGILPNSPAVDNKKNVVYYQAPDFLRITLSAKGLRQLDEVILFAKGKQKQSALDKLVHKTEPINQLPVQIIKQIASWSVYNDLEGVAL